MNELEVPVLTGIIWIGAILAVILGTVSHLLNYMAKGLLLGIAKLNRRLKNKEEYFAYYGLSGLEIAKHAAGIVLATLPEDDSPPRTTKQHDEKSTSVPGQSSSSGNHGEFARETSVEPSQLNSQDRLLDSQEMQSSATCSAGEEQSDLESGEVQMEEPGKNSKGNVADQDGHKGDRVQG